MNARALAVLLLVPLLLLLLPRVSAEAGIHTYTEDFTTEGYCDSSGTTAWWDTAAGELKLYPYEMKTVASVPTPGDARPCAVVDGDYLYLTMRISGLEVFDISDPTNPQRVGTCPVPDHILKIEIAGDYLFAAGVTAGLVVIDISDPTNPELAATCDTPDWARGVTIHGDHAFVGSGLGHLRIIDISNPTDPEAVGWVPALHAVAVLASGDHLYVSVDYGVAVFDISDPVNPQQIALSPIPGSPTHAIALHGNYLFVGHHGVAGFQVIDVSDPSAPVNVHSWTAGLQANNIVIDGDRAYVACEPAGLLTFDIADPANPVFLQELETPTRHAQNLAVSGKHAFVGDESGGLQVIRIAEPRSPACSGHVATEDIAYGIALDGDHAYVADWSAGVRVVDISDPANPCVVGGVDTPSASHRLEIGGDYAYVADMGSGLQVVDISDPSSPSIAGSVDTPNEALDVALAGDYAYVADRESGLRVIDVTDPTNPEEVGAYDTPGLATSVVVAGDHVYVGDYEAGMQVLNVADPPNPTWVSSVDTPGGVYDLAVSGDRAYLADWTGGLCVIDISDPASPMVTGSLATADRAYGVDLTGDYALVADWSAGLQVIDIADPSNPVIVDGLATGGLADGVAVAGDNAYVVSRSSGLDVIEVLQRSFDTTSNVGRSLPVDGCEETILRAQLETVQADGVDWELSADGGVNWEAFVPGAGWHDFAHHGSDLLWRSEHVYGGAGVNPACSFLEIAWESELAAVIDIDPNIVNCRSHGPLTCYVELPEGSEPADIDIETVMLNDTLHAYTWPVEVGDYDLDGTPDLMVKFSRAEVIDLLPEGEEVEVTVAGELIDGTAFAGTDVINIICKHPPRDASPVSPPGLKVNPGGNGSGTVISYTVSEAGPVSLRVYDVSGRLVATLAAGNRSVGDYEVAWDRRSDDGGRVGSGVYFIRLDGSGVTATEKVVVLR